MIIDKNDGSKQLDPDFEPREAEDCFLYIVLGIGTKEVPSGLALINEYDMGLLETVDENQARLFAKLKVCIHTVALKAFGGPKIWHSQRANVLQCAFEYHRAFNSQDLDKYKRITALYEHLKLL